MSPAAIARNPALDELQELHRALGFEQAKNAAIRIVQEGLPDGADKLVIMAEINLLQPKETTQ